MFFPSISTDINQSADKSIMKLINQLFFLLLLKFNVFAGIKDRVVVVAADSDSSSSINPSSTIKSSTDLATANHAADSVTKQKNKKEVSDMMCTHSFISF